MSRFPYFSFLKRFFIAILLLVVGLSCKNGFPETERSITFYRLYVQDFRDFHWFENDPDSYVRFEKALFEEIVLRSRSYAQQSKEEYSPNAIRSLFLSGELRDNSCIEGGGKLSVLKNHHLVSLEALGFWMMNPEKPDGTPLFLGSNISTPFLVLEPGAESAPSENTEFSSEIAEPESETAENPQQEREPGSQNEIEVLFQWSQQGRKDSQGRIVFDLSTPNALHTVLELELESDWEPSLSSGILFEIPTPITHVSSPRNEESGSAFAGFASGKSHKNEKRTWCILPDIRNQSVLTLTSLKMGEDARNHISVRQSLTYDLRAEGLDIDCKFHFERHLTSTRSIALQLDVPLRINSIQCGNKNLSWTRGPSPSGDWEDSIYLTIPEGERGIQIQATAPLIWDRDWDLPGIRIQSSAFFWSETRADVLLEEPLLLNALHFRDAAQTHLQDVPDRRTDWIGEGYSFHYFAPDSKLTVALSLSKPNVVWKSGTYINWEEDRISGTMYLDFTSLRGNSQLVELQVQPGWSIDISSVEALSKEDFLLWEEDFESDSSHGTESGKNENPEKSLFVYLKKPTRLKLTGLYPISESKSVHLRDFLMVRVRQSHNGGYSSGSITNPLSEDGFGKHLVALNTNTSNRLRVIAPVGMMIKPISFVDPLVRECFFTELPVGNSSIYLLETNSRSIEVKLEPLRLHFDSQTHCELILLDEELIQKCRFRCTATEPRIDHVYVHFSQESEVPWIWSLSSGEKPPASRILGEQERKILNFPVPNGGKIWEIRFHPPRSGTFHFNAERRVKVEKQTPIPLPMLPESPGNPIEIIVQAPYTNNIEVLNNRLKSIPVQSSSRKEYQTIRAAFRYNPEMDADSQENPALFLRPAPLGKQTHSAWVWSLQMDSQFESGGIVREHATFFIENRGQKEIVITLPEGIRFENIHAVWIDEKRVTWFPKKEKEENSLRDRASYELPPEPNTPLSMSADREKNSRSSLSVVQGHKFREKELPENKPRRISLTLPEKQRYSTVSLEYWKYDEPLVHRKKLYPQYPSIDLPVLSGTWIAWTPPEFQTFLRTKPEGLVVSEYRRKKDLHLFSEPGLEFSSFSAGWRKKVHSFNPFSTQHWANLFSFDHRKKTCVEIAERMIVELENEARSGGRTGISTDSQRPGSEDLSVDPEVANPSSSPEPSGTSTGPGTVSATERTWGEILGNPRFIARVFGDSSQIVPPKIMIDWIALCRIGIFPTTPLGFSRESSFLGSGHSVLEDAGITLLFLDEKSVLITSALNAAKYQWELESLYGDRTKMIKDGPLANHFREALSGDALPQWIPLSTWNNRAASQTNPWGNSSPSSQIASIASGWNAIELRKTESTRGVYIAHRPTLSALGAIMFLLVIVFSRWRPFSNLIFLSVLLMVFGIAAKLLPPYHSVVPTGAFFGAMGAIAFAMIRRTPPPSGKIILRRSSSSKIYEEESSDAQYEVKELRPFYIPHLGANRESFFDSLQKESENKGSGKNPTEFDM